MTHDTRDLRTEHAASPASWGISVSDAHDGWPADPATWLTGGAALLLWTALAVLLTSA